MSKKVTISNAAKEFEASTSEITRTNILKKANVRTYLPIEEKRKSIEELIMKYLIEFLDSHITYDSIDKMVIFMMSVVSNYSDLIAEDLYDDFDCLMSSGLMGGILEMIGGDVEAYRDLFELRLSDYIREHNSLEAILVRKANGFIEPLEKLVGSITGLLNSISAEELLDVMKNSIGASNQ